MKYNNSAYNQLSTHEDIKRLIIDWWRYITNYYLTCEYITEALIEMHNHAVTEILFSNRERKTVFAPLMKETTAANASTTNRQWACNLKKWLLGRLPGSHSDHIHYSPS